MIKKLFIYVFLILLGSSCKKSGDLDCFKSNGPQTTVTRYPDPFDVVEVFDKIEVSIRKGSEYKVEVVAGGHIIKNISTVVKGGKLSINNDNTCNFVRGYKRQIAVNITMPYVSRVENRGVGAIRFAEDFIQDSMKVVAENSGDVYINGTYTTMVTSSHGNGDIYLNGSCRSLYVYMYGTNFLHADEFLISDYIFVETYSIGDCFVNAASVSTLNSKLWRSGNVYYKGNPPVVNAIYLENCKGRLIKEE